MTSDQNREREREKILMDFLMGKVDPESEEGKAMMERNPWLREELEEVKALSLRLDRAAARMEADVRELPEEPPPSPTVEEALKRAWDEDRGQGRTPGRSSSLMILIPLGIAAALVIFLLVLWRVGQDSGKHPPQYLSGDSELKVTLSSNDVDSFKVSWNDCMLSPGGLYRIYINTGTEEIRAWQGRDLSWDPTPEDRAKLSDSNELWVQTYEPNEDFYLRSKSFTLIRRKN
jgi:hypothetical protein